MQHPVLIVSLAPFLAFIGKVQSGSRWFGDIILGLMEKFTDVGMVNVTYSYVVYKLRKVVLH